MPGGSGQSPIFLVPDAMSDASSPAHGKLAVRVPEMLDHTTQTRHQTNVNKLIKAIFRRHTHHRTGMKIKQSGHTP